MKTSTTLRSMKQLFYISGLHCPSCEILIEKKLLKQQGVVKAEVSLAKSTLSLETKRNIKISLKDLNDIFLKDNYRFSLKPFSKQNTKAVSCPIEKKRLNVFSSLFFSLLFILVFILLGKSGFSSLISVNAQSSLPVFFLFGLLAGFSSCAALVGGIILSLSQQWNNLYSNSDSTVKKLQPHFLFNTGRVLSYLAFGAILGQIGNFFRLTPLFSASLVIAVSVLMILLGLQMLGIKALQKFRLQLPKSLTRRFSDESNFTGKFAPVIMGALTFFLPCGFTITVQALALASGNPIQGALIMGLFAIGTLPGLLTIGLTSIKLFSNPKFSQQFSIIAGILVLFFAFFNINAQLAVLGVSNLESLTSPKTISQNIATDLPPIIDGKQIIHIKASSAGYAPNKLKVRAGIPVKWEIEDTGTSGCTNAIISRQLFSGQIDLVPGTTSVKEFTVNTPGIYRFSCWMGMVTGTFEVLDKSGNINSVGAAPTIIESGAKGCGCHH